MFLSTSEKLGCDELLDALELPPLAAGEEDEDDDGLEEDEDGVLDEEDDGLLVELLPLDDDGDVAEGVLDVDGLLDDDEDDWATASDDSASITAAAVTPRVLGMEGSPDGWKKTTPGSPQALCRMSEGTPSNKAPLAGERS